MKMKKWKKNLVAGAVLFCVCAGIYTNWYYTEEAVSIDLTQTLDSEKLLNADRVVMSDEVVPLNEAQATTMSQYFASVRLSRQQARDEAVALLQEVVSADEEQQANSSDQLENIVQTALCEAQIESLVIAKGYVDCVAYIGQEGISVAVASPDNGLQEQDVAVIADIVLTQSDFSLSDIRIVEVH